jgi:hypothetical protein
VHAGLGHRSLLAAAAGAAAVYAVEPTWLAEHCSEAVRANGADGVVTVLRRSVGKGLVLPTQTVDIIMCSWVGPAGLFDSLVGAVVWARDRFLAADGVILPNRATLNLFGAELVTPTAPRGWHAAAAEMAAKRRGDGDGDGDGGAGVKVPKAPFSWGDVYGFDMSTISASMREQRGRSREIYAGEYSALTETVAVHEINVMECPLSDTSFATRFTLPTAQATDTHGVDGVGDGGGGRCDGLVVNTVVHFDHCVAKPSFSSGATGSHVGNVFFELRKPLDVHLGGCVSGKYQCAFIPTDRPSGRASCDIGLLDVVTEGPCALASAPATH